ncbi:MAG: D-ribitol-5-phosphate cytidylyltransferase [Candidatus Improbicoccus pseudotrichonymphae]|uniref:D-ribitol-5-phosphate cytidylyltransferase n=1 Tax=Candidatus Improbicoccus pseudotrichonymphae TaxID=3033792 RepID=A0AA48HUX0_9FIRM|nr:MAG: D-ribitol-5-phosphate cytidylyltransferase [Candidatus Improbicoccus pseudotrichonymphae]
MIFAAIVAGGLGLRMGLTDIPKQFMCLAEKPIIIHTIEKFLVCSDFDYIYVGIHKDWKLYLKDILKKFNLENKKIVLVNGGKDRNLTIMNIIDAIEKDFPKCKDAKNIIVTHDAVRPFVALRIIEENIKAAQEFDACDTVVSSYDTVIRSNKDKTMIEEVPEREFMFLGQTPQSFNMGKLKEFYSNLSDEDKKSLTDACKIFSLNNHPVKIVIGEFSNIKITNLNDLKIANVLVT